MFMLLRTAFTGVRSVGAAGEDYHFQLTEGHYDTCGIEKSLFRCVLIHPSSFLFFLQESLSRDTKARGTLKTQSGRLIQCKTLTCRKVLRNIKLRRLAGLISIPN